MEPKVDQQVKQVQEKQKSNKIKLQVRQLLLQIDAEKQGYIKDEIFQRITSLYKIILSQSGIKTLKRICAVPGKPHMIRYKEALQRLSPNFEVDEPLMKEWVVRVDRDATAYSAMLGTSIRSNS